MNINLTHECNWHCWYCITNTHKSKQRPIEKVLYDIRQMPDNTILSLSGGEPGLLSKNSFLQVLEIAKKKVTTYPFCYT